MSASQIKRTRLPLGRRKLYSPSKRALAYNYRFFGFLAVLGSASLPAIQRDRVQLQQVILNFLINVIGAMSGMSEGSRGLLISTARREVGFVVSVRYSRPGGDSPQCRTVLESLYTTKPGGGLELSICRLIIEAHGGSLWTSANEPRRAEFQFTLAA
jgi:C4-dicarboxylate-specific signal transduction histidine kinase